MVQIDNLTDTQGEPLAEQAQVSLRALTADNVTNVVDVHFDSFKATPSFSKSLGRNFVNKTYTWFCNGPGRFGYVAYVGDSAAGFITGSFFVPFQKLNEYRRLSGILSLARRPHIFFSRQVCGKLIRAQLTGTPIELDFLGNNIGFIYSIAVRSTFQNMRIGRHLMSAFANHARDQGKDKIVIPVGKNNDASLALCRSLGYIPEPEIKDPENTYLVKIL